MKPEVTRLPRMPEGWAQINFRAPESWRKAAELVQVQAKQKGELISFEEACRRLFRRGAEAEGVWSATEEAPKP